MRRQLLLTMLLLICFNLFAQKKKTSGVIVDQSGFEIIGASIIEVGTTNGTITDLDGRFSLMVVSNAQLEISYIGYQKKVVSVKNQKFLKIVLKEDTEILDEVVVTAYGGKQLRSKVTNSISKVDKGIFKNGAYSDPAKALIGAVSGMSVIPNSASPTSSPTIILRGGTNFNGSGSPLYIVDGQLRTMQGLNPEDIESMEVLKDAGATAIYGARANNGVILITTKKGVSGKSSINVKTKLSINYFNNPYDFLNARDYIHTYRTSTYNGAHIYQDSKGAWKGWCNMATVNGASPAGTGNIYFDNDGNPVDGNKNPLAVWSTMIYNDKLAFLLDDGWQKMQDPISDNELIFYDFSMEDVNIKTPSYTQDYNISASGGNDEAHYYSCLGFNKDNGEVPGNFYQRLNFTFNGDYKIKPWLKSISSFKYIKEDWKGLPASQGGEANYFGRVIGAPPTMRGKNPNGEWLLGKSSSDGNQLVTVNQRKRKANRNQLDMNQAFEFNIIDGLKFRVSAFWLFREDFSENFDKDYLIKPGVMSQKRTAYNKMDRKLSQTYTSLLTYNKKFGEHSVDLMAGTEYYRNKRYGFNCSGINAPTDDFQDLTYTSTDEGLRRMDSWHNEERILSFFGRANYDYQSKYLMSFVIRKDGYSKLIGDNRWGIFPGISTGWVFGKEDFMEPYRDIVSFAKLRASYGVNGNVSGIGLYELQGSYSSNKYNGNVGFRLNDLPSPFLVWEKSHTFEVGLDLSFLENRINTNFSFYNRRTLDKFANIPLPSSSGKNSIRSNNGEIQNQGLEFDLGFKILQMNQLTWNMKVNGAFSKSKVTKLPDNGVQNNRQGGTQVYDPNNPENLIWVGGYQEGQRPGQIYCYEYQGVYKSYDEIPGDLVDIQGGKTLYGPDAWAALSDVEKLKGWPIQPGDAVWRDVNGDDRIDSFDRVKVGNVRPTVTGGFSTDLNWKGFTLGARFDYALGHYVYDSREQWILGGGQGSFNMLTKTKDRAWSENNSNGDLPIYGIADANGKRNYQRYNTIFAKKGDYLAFRELSLNYTLPKSVLSTLNVQNITVSVTGQNLGYWTASKDLRNPDMYRGNNNGRYSLPTNLIFGLNLAF